MNEAQETVCTTMRVGDMKMLWVVYVSGFIARRHLMVAEMLSRPVCYLKHHHQLMST